MENFTPQRSSRLRRALLTHTLLEQAAAQVRACGHPEIAELVDVARARFTSTPASEDVRFVDIVSIQRKVERWTREPAEKGASHGNR